MAKKLIKNNNNHSKSKNFLKCQFQFSLSTMSIL